VKRLHALRRIEGSNKGIDYRWAEGRNERYSKIATNFVRFKVDVIIAIRTSSR